MSRHSLRPTTRPSAHRRMLSVLGVVLVVTLLGTACTSSDEADAPTAPETTSQTNGGPTTTTPDGADDPTGDPSPMADGIRIEVLSSQPDRATGPEARIRVTPPEGADPTTLTVTVADRDVTTQLETVDGALEGVVTGLVEGNNAITASNSDPASGPTDPVTQRVRSWPLTGPMISGPQTPLLACSTEDHGLGPATDDQCSAATKVTWSYVTDAGDRKPLEDPTGKPPTDIAMTTVEGQAVPMTIRVETGVVNRSVYEIATLDPSPGGSDADQGDAAWNGQLIYRFGPGCATTFGQGQTETRAAEPSLLSEGYAVATATFNTGAVQCNDVVSAETAMMVKERFIEEFGRPDSTIAESAQWGSATALLVIQDYPGLLDGAVAAEPLPDVATMLGPISDCGLLNTYYRTTEGSSLSPDQRRAINGHASTKTCDNWETTSAELLDPTAGCDTAVPTDRLYAAGSNPTGVRCTYQDGSANQYGTDPGSGFALRPLDNVGLQYGLAALNEGAISFDQFDELNTSIGGYDIDGAVTPDREAADVSVVQTAYETGRVSTGVGDQPKVPIIMVSNYDDRTGSVTDHLRPFSVRDRLTRGQAAEAAPGLRIWTREPAVTPPAEASTAALGVIAGWLRQIDAGRGGNDRSETLRSTRPEAALDSCLPAGSTEPISATELYDDAGPCRDDYPINADPRIVAGAPQTGDVIKCRLKPVDPSDYDQDVTSAQLQRLVQVFPDGVCDWSQAGAGQTVPSMSDRTYEDVITPGEMA